MRIELNADERYQLLHILNKHLEEMDDTREAMIEDTATLNTLDTFSATLQQHDIDKEIAESIKRKVLEDNDDDDAGRERTSGTV